MFWDTRSIGNTHEKSRNLDNFLKGNVHAEISVKNDLSICGGSPNHYKNPHKVVWLKKFECFGTPDSRAYIRKIEKFG